MLGSLHKKGKTFYIVFDQGRDPVTNKRKQKWISLGTTDRKVAAAKYADMVKEINTGSYIEPAKMSLGEYLKKWLEHIATNVRASTHESYTWAAGHVIKGLGYIALDKLKPLHIQEHLTKARRSKLSPTSVRYQYNILREALTQAVKWELLAVNPCAAIDPPRKEKFQAKVYTPDQLQQLLEAAQSSNINLPVVLAVTCGMRRGEVCGLRWQDISFDKSILFVRNSLDWENSQLKLRPVKTSTSERSVKLPQLALDVLKIEKRQQAEDKLRAGGMYDDKDFCWAWDDGRPHDPDYLYKQFRKVLAENKLPQIRFHDLRHSHATFLLLAGVPIKVISERLGHSSTKITQDIYSHVLPQMQEQAADEVDRILAKK